MVERKLSRWQSYFVNDLNSLGSFVGWELSWQSTVDRSSSGLETEQITDLQAVIGSINLVRGLGNMPEDGVSCLGLSIAADSVEDSKH